MIQRAWFHKILNLNGLRCGDDRQPFLNVLLCGEASASIIVTKSADDYGIHNASGGEKLIRIPAFAFLYLPGNAEKHGYRAIE